MAKSMFSGSSYPMRLVVMLYNQTKRGKSKMAAAKLEIHNSRRARRKTISTALDELVEDSQCSWYKPYTSEAE